MSDTPSQRRDEGREAMARTRRAPRQARAAETRRRLLEAGFDAFAARGFDGVNLVEDVLEPAGISIGSFYHQFADKAELLREILVEAADRRRAFIVQLGELDATSDLQTTVRLVVERLYDSLERDGTAWRLQRVSRIAGDDGIRDLGSAARENWNAAVAELLRRWFDQPPSELRRASDPVVTLARGFVYDFLDTPADQRRSRREQVSVLSAFVVGGLTALLGAPRPTPRADS